MLAFWVRSEPHNEQSKGTGLVIDSLNYKQQQHYEQHSSDMSTYILYRDTIFNIHCFYYNWILWMHVRPISHVCTINCCGFLLFLNETLIRICKQCTVQYSVISHIWYFMDLLIENGTSMSLHCTWCHPLHDIAHLFLI